MGPGPLQLAAVAGLVLCAALLVRIPRALFTEAAEQRPSNRVEVSLMLVLAAVGVVGFFSGLGRGVEARFAFALALMTFAAVVYSDFSFLVIPDLYSLVLVLLAALAPWRFSLQEAMFGALVCGGLLAVLAFLWHRLTSVEGLGFGDVKLAAVTGALLGAQPGLYAISASAAVAVVLALIVRAVRRNKDEEMLVPYGAALALAAAGFLARGLA
jgi:prepilin signal peptidase PulO-like enzyme (type II secretory pathway)